MAIKETKVSYRLSQSPTEPFRMRFSRPNAKELVDKIMADAKEEMRSFPSMIERILINHYGLNKKSISKIKSKK